MKIVSLALNDFRSVLKVISNVDPDEIYNLAGQTSVSLSFEQPIEAMDSIAIGTLNLLEVMRYLDKNIRFLMQEAQNLSEIPKIFLPTKILNLDPEVLML